jgi:putative transcriptional regulator
MHPESGKILISEPLQTDVCFHRSVILLTEHGSRGSMGFVLNKKTNLFVNSYFEQLKNTPLIPVFLGGPIISEYLFFIHSLGKLIPDSIEIADNLFQCGDFESIMYRLLGKEPYADKIKFFIGYSGWTADQLQNEIKQGSWLVGNPPKSSDVMLANNESFWEQAVRSVGGKHLRWLNYPRNPQLN